MEKWYKGEMPTIEEMKEKVGLKWLSHQGRIGGYLDKEVLAFGIGYKGFVGVVEGTHRYFAFSVNSHGFDYIQTEKVLEEIKSNDLFVDKKITDKAFEDKQIEKFQGPTVAIFEYEEIDYEQNNDDKVESSYKTEYKISRFKNKKLKIMQASKHGGEFMVRREDFLRQYKCAMNNAKLGKRRPDNKVHWRNYCEETKITKNTVTEELIKEIENEKMLNDI